MHIYGGIVVNIESHNIHYNTHFSRDFCQHYTSSHITHIQHVVLSTQHHKRSIITHIQQGWHNTGSIIAHMLVGIAVNKASQKIYYNASYTRKDCRHSITHDFFSRPNDFLMHPTRIILGKKLIRGPPKIMYVLFGQIQSQWTTHDIGKCTKIGHNSSPCVQVLNVPATPLPNSFFKCLPGRLLHCLCPGESPQNCTGLSVTQAIVNLIQMNIV